MDRRCLRKGWEKHGKEVAIFPEKIWFLPVATAQKKEKKKTPPKGCIPPHLCRGDSSRSQAFEFVQSWEASVSGVWVQPTTPLIQEPDWCFPFMGELTENLGF